MESYFCTRPAMAAWLMARGFQCERQPSPFRDGFFVWIFPYDDGLYDAVTTFLIENDLKRHIKRTEGGDAD